MDPDCGSGETVKLKSKNPPLQFNAGQKKFAAYRSGICTPHLLYSFYFNSKRHTTSSASPGFKVTGIASGSTVPNLPLS